jgi:hypothetical protein
MAQKRTGLGRGIGALIPGAPATGDRPVDVFFPASTEQGDMVSIPGATLVSVPPSSIRPNPHQPRKEFRQEELDELIHSVTEFGVLQPIVVRPLASPDGDVRFELARPHKTKFLTPLSKVLSKQPQSGQGLPAEFLCCGRFGFNLGMFHVKHSLRCSGDDRVTVSAFTF